MDDCIKNIYIIEMQLHSVYYDVLLEGQEGVS